MGRSGRQLGNTEWVVIQFRLLLSRPFFARPRTGSSRRSIGWEHGVPSEYMCLPADWHVFVASLVFFSLLQVTALIANQVTFGKTAEQNVYGRV